MFGKVLEVPQTERTPFYPALPVRRGQGLRALDHGQLPRELRPVRGERASCSTTGRRGAGSSSSSARSATASRASSTARDRSCGSATSTRGATGASPATTWRRCGACSSTTSPATTWSRAARRTRSASCASSRSRTSGSTGPTTSCRTSGSTARPRSTCSIGDPAKAAAELGWEPRTSFPALVEMMVDADLAALDAHAARFHSHRFEMMPDASGIAHAACRDDDVKAGQLGDRTCFHRPSR